MSAKLKPVSGHLRFLIPALAFVSTLAFAESGELDVAVDATIKATGKLDAVDIEHSGLPSISPLDTIHIGVGNPWDLYLRGRTPNGVPPIMIGMSLPAGMSMTAVGEGWYRMRWQPRSDQLGYHALKVRAMDQQDPQKLFDRGIEIEVQNVAVKKVENRVSVPAGANPVFGKLSAHRTSRSSYIGVAVAEADATEQRAQEAVLGLSGQTSHQSATRQAPILNAIATHIISVGRTLRVRVAPELDNDLPPIIQIDRLPANASFDVNEDGSRTFFWPTGESDQGQHRFRFTAIHPDDASLKVSQELTVYIGDSTKQISAPSDL